VACSRGGADDSAGVVQRLIVHAVLGFFVAAYAVAMAYRPVHAQQEYIPRGQPIPENIRYVNATATGAQTTASVSWTSAMGHTSHHRLPVHVSAATLGRLANAAVRRGLPLVGWGLTFKGLLDAAGWAIDELQQQVINPGDKEPMNPLGWCDSSRHCANSVEAMKTHAQQDHCNQVCRNLVVSWVFVDQGGTAGAIRGETASGGVLVHLPMNYRAFGSSDVDVNPGSGPSPVSDDELGQMIKHTPQVVNAILIDPQTGAPIRTQELTDALNALRTQLETANGQAAGTDLVAATDYAESTPSQTEWPEFCGWANRLCDWLFEEEATDEHPDVPYVEVQPDNLDGFDSGFGSGGCPAPYVVGVLDGEFEIQWDGLCGFVDYLRPVVIAFSWLAAAFIVVQTVRSR
jgi:hypothetical protein